MKPVDLDDQIIVEVKPDKKAEIGHYRGSVTVNDKLIHFSLRPPTMEDLDLTEALVNERKEKTNRPITNSMSLMIIFSLLCEKWGDQKGLELDELLKMPISISKEVTSAVANFRSLFSGEE